MKTLNCCSIIKLYEVWESSNSIYFIMDYCQHGSLLDKIIYTKALKLKKIE